METRKVGERGQVTIPKKIREEEKIRGGDEVIFEKERGRIYLKKKQKKEKLKECYKKMAERDKKINKEMFKASKEALGRI